MENYKNPPIPAGYSHVSGEWDTGFIIKRDSDGSEFVWIPTETLPKDGKIGKEKGFSFGYRPYGYSGGIDGDVPAVLAEQVESVKKYGGFYITRYTLSLGADGEYHSHPNALPHTGICRDEADEIGSKFALSQGVKSHLPYAAEMDSAACWLIENGKKTQRDITDAGDKRDVRGHSDEVTMTASDEALYAMGIYDLAGTVDEWTQEAYDGAHLWGCCKPCAYPLAYRCYFVPYPCYTYTGLRAALYIE